MKILITGAGGMLGSDLAAILGPQFSCVGAGRNPAPHLQIPYRQQDLTFPGAIAKILLEEKPDLVFHAAAMTQVDDCERNREMAMLLNYQMTRDIVTACNAAGAFLIFFSTDYVFDGKKKGEYLEDDPVHPGNIYGESKALAENFIRETAEHYTIFRVSWLYGRRGKSFPRTLLERAGSQKVFEVVSDQTGRPTYTRDLAKAVQSLLLRGPEILETIDHQIFHLANEGAVSWAGFAERILKAGKYPESQVIPVTSGQLKRPARRPENSVLSTKKAESILKLQLRSWQEALTDFIAEITPELRPAG